MVKNVQLRELIRELNDLSFEAGVHGTLKGRAVTPRETETVLRDLLDRVCELEGELCQKCG